MKFTLAALIAGLLANQQPQPRNDLSEIPFDNQSYCSQLNHLKRYPEDRSDAIRRYGKNFQFD